MTHCPNTVSLFIGSSFKLMSYRHCVGNMLRKLNDQWELHGVRLYLKRWEDFRTEYESKSKQEEYIDELVLPSDICAFFFRDEIGKYTEQEMDARLKSSGYDGLLCYRVPDGAGNFSNDVKTKLEGKGLKVIDVENEASLAAAIQNEVDAYIKSHKKGGISLNAKKEYRLYTTIPDDNADRRDEFGTTIRNLDDLCEEMLNVRCKLHPLRHPKLLEVTDHYVPFLYKQIADVDLKEMSDALTLLDANTRLKDITLFYRQGSKIFDDVEVKKLIGKRDLFGVKVKSPDTINWRLFTWILKRQSAIDVALAGFTVADKYLYINGRPLVEVDTLDDSGKINALLSEKDSICQKIDKLLAVSSNNKNDLKIKRLNGQKRVNEAKLLAEMTDSIYQWIYEELTSEAEDVSGPIDIDQVNAVIEISESHLQSIENQKASALKSLQQHLAMVNARLKALGVDIKHQAEKEELKALAEVREKLTRSLVNFGAVSPQQLLNVQLYLIGVHDSYLHPFIVTPEEDAIYERIINDSESYNLKDVRIEKVRYNFGNHYHRNREFAKAREYYETCLRNVRQIDDDSQSVLRFKTSLYLELCVVYRDSRNYEKLKEVLGEFEKHVDHCMTLSGRYLIDKGIYLSFLLTSPIPDSREKERIIKEAMAVCNQITERFEIPVEDDWFGLACVQLPNLIAGYWIDNYYRDIKNTIEQAKHYLQICELNVQKLMRENIVEGLFYDGEVKHQMGFLHYLIGELPMAEDCYLRAVKSKQRLMKIRNDSSDSFSYANTLVNWGAAKVAYLELALGGRRVPIPNIKLETMVEDALEIYENYAKKGDAEAEQKIYETLQLLGTIYYYRGKLSGHKAITWRGIRLLQQCYEWDRQHPENTYHEKFIGCSGMILREEGLI